MRDEFIMRDFDDRRASITLQPLAEQRRINNSALASVAVFYLVVVGAMGAKLLGYDVGPLGPAGTAIATGALTYPVARWIQDYRDGVF